ncbi:MAG: response regulator transcription factor [Lachnospiraceae bacterium]|nr:response regulator transcription factor [Lachnospiraceae bacterium]MBQ6258414.1 response regulator transcription factor [Lachnospiraceae bacterium]
MNEKKILVVDDESRIRKLIKDYLRRGGYEVIEASDGEEALEIFYKTKDISLIILDVMMPNLDGWEVLKEIRESSRVPIIMLTAKSEEEDELNGYSLGADEYVLKPFSPKVLVARVEAVLRRSLGEETSIIENDGIRIDENAHEVTVDGKNVELSVREYDLLKYFMKNPGIALSREKILNSVWDYDYYGDARTIDTHVKKLRSKLLDKGDLIKTIWGVGYKFGSSQ